jgi:hypothetical protein
VALTGPGGKRLLLSSGPVAAYYYAEAPTDQLPFFTQGAWRLAATGGPDLRAFQVDFALPPPLQFSNFSDRTIVPSQGYTVRWLPFNTGSIVSVNLFGTGVFATCAAPDWAGQLLLPAAVLERFKGSSTTFVSIVRPRPQARTMFSIPVNTGEPIRGVAGWGLSQRITAMVQ